MKKRYVLYKTDDWSYPLLWQWHYVKEDGWPLNLGKGFFPSLLSSLEEWECIYDRFPKKTKQENMKYVIGFEKKEDAIDHGIRKKWIRKIR